jgi:hypothetical protein
MYATSLPIECYPIIIEAFDSYTDAPVWRETVRFPGLFTVPSPTPANPNVWLRISWADDTAIEAGRKYVMGQGIIEMPYRYFEKGQEIPNPTRRKGR